MEEVEAGPTTSQPTLDPQSEEPAGQAAAPPVKNSQKTQIPSASYGDTCECTLRVTTFSACTISWEGTPSRSPLATSALPSNQASGSEEASDATPLYTIVLDPRCGVGSRFSNQVLTEHVIHTANPLPHNRMSDDYCQLQLGTFAGDTLGVYYTSDNEPGTVTRLSINDLLASDAARITGGTPDGPHWRGSLILASGAELPLRPARAEDYPGPVDISTFRCVDIYENKECDMVDAHVIQTKWTSPDPDWAALGDESKISSDLAPFSTEVRSRLRDAGLTAVEHFEHLRRRDWLNVLPETFPVVKLGHPTPTTSAAGVATSSSSLTLRDSDGASACSSSKRSRRGGSQTAGPAKRSQYHMEPTAPAAPLQVTRSPVPVSDQEGANVPYSALGHGSPSAHDSDHVEMENEDEELPTLDELRSTDYLSRCHPVAALEPFPDDIRARLLEEDKHDFMIEYCRGRTSQRVLQDYTVLIDGQVWHWQSIRPGEVGSEEHLNATSADMVFLQPSERNVDLQCHRLKSTIRRVIDDLHNAMMHLETNDALLAIPAVFWAYQTRQASQLHRQMESADWIRKFLELLHDEGRTDPVSFPYARASLRLKLMRPDIPADTKNSHGHLQTARKPNGMFYTAAEQQDHARHLRRRQARAESQLLARENAEVNYVLDWKSVRELSCVNTLEHFIAYNKTQCEYYGMAAPLSTTPEHLREVPGYLSININDEQLVLHGVWYCKSYTDNVIVVAHLVVATNWWIDRLSGFLVGPTVGTKYHLTEFTDAHAVGLEYAVHDQQYVWVLNVKRGVNMGTTSSNKLLVTQPPLSTGVWGAATSPILGENLPVNLRLRAVASDLTTSDILAFLKTHTQPSTRELPYQTLAGFLEQPSVRPVNPQSVQDREALAVACTRPDDEVLDDEEPRLWSILHPSVWRPSPETMAWRQNSDLDPLGCAQRARGTAVLPNLNTPETFLVTAQNPETNQSDDRINAALSGDQKAYLDNHLAEYLGLLAAAAAVDRRCSSRNHRTTMFAAVNRPATVHVHVSRCTTDSGSVPLPKAAGTAACTDEWELRNPGTSSRAWTRLEIVEALLSHPRLTVPTPEPSSEVGSNNRPRPASLPSESVEPSPSRLRRQNPAATASPATAADSMSSVHAPVPGPSLRLSKTIAGLSRLNADCEHLVENLTEWEVEELQLPELDDDLRWVRLCVKTSPGEVWSIFARYSPTSRFPDNVLCSRHALTRDAIICTTDLQPTIHLHGWVFALESKPYEDGTALFLRFPLEHGTSEFRHLPPDATISRERQATFWPSSHALNYATLDHDSAPRILREAGISDEAMSRWVSSHLPGAWDDGMARWKLLALAHVREHWHLPTRDLLLFDTASDLDEPPDAPGYLTWKRHVTSLDRVWRYPRVQVHLASQPSPASNPGLESTTHVNASIDIMAPFPLMSRSFALRARIDLRALDTTEAGFLFELRPGLGRMHQLGSPAHRTRYWGLGFTTVRCNFGGISADHWVSVRIMVFEDRALDRRSCVDVIFHRTLMEDLSHNLAPKMGSDPMSRSFSRSSGYDSHMTLIAAASPTLREEPLEHPEALGPAAYAALQPWRTPDDSVTPTADERPSAAGAGTAAAPPTRLPSDRDGPAVHNAPLGVPPAAISPVDVSSARAPPGGADDPDRDDNDPDEDPDDRDPGPTVPARCHHCGLVVAIVNGSWEAHNRVCPTLLLVTSTLADAVDETGASSTLAGAGGASPSSPGLLGVTYEPDEMTLTAAAFQAKAQTSAVKPEVSPHATPFDAGSPGPPAALFAPLSQSTEWQSLPAQRAMDSSSFALSPDTSLGLLRAVEPGPPSATGPAPCNLCHGTIRTPTSGPFSANDCACRTASSGAVDTALPAIGGVVEPVPDTSGAAGSGPARTPSSGSAGSSGSSPNAPPPLPLPDARALADRISQGHRDSAAWQLRADKEIARSRQAATSNSNALAAVVGDLQTVHASSAATTAVLQQLLDETKQMRSETTTRAHLMEDRLSIMQVATTSAIESSENTLHARLTPMVTQLLHSGMTPMVNELREANRELSESLATLSTRMDNITSSRRRDSHEGRLLDVVLDNTRAQIAPAVLNSSTGATAAAHRPAPVPHGTVAPGNDSEPRPTENEFHHAPLTEVQRLRASESNLQHALDMANARARDNASLPPPAPRHEPAQRTMMGGFAFTGHGGELPSPNLVVGSTTPDSVIGAGSTHCHTGVATPILFTNSSEAASYITTAFQGGRPTTSDVGKPWEDKNGIRKFTGANRGVSDNATTGVCAINFLSSVVAFHSTKRHDNAELLGRAMRSTVLTNLADAVRHEIEQFDHNADWPAFALNFIQSCGPVNIRDGVCNMIAEVTTVTTPRTLMQRSRALVNAWTTAQNTFYGVHPELDGRGQSRPPHHCSPFVPRHEQLHALKLLVQGADKSLWQQYCATTPQRTQRNPALLWNWILTLNSEVLALTVAPSTTKLLVGDTKQPFMTDGHVVTSIPLAAAKSLDRQAGAYNLMIETNKINHIAERSSPVRKDVMDFCLAAGTTREEIDFRHVHGKCYYCGDDVRKGGNIVHTYLNCEKRLAIESVIRAKMEASFRSDGPTAPHASQRLANEKQTTSEDTTAATIAEPTTEATTTTALAENLDADTRPAVTSHGLATTITATTTTVMVNATNDRDTAQRPRTNGFPTNEATVLHRAKRTPHGKNTGKINHLLTAPPLAANDLDDDASPFSDHESPAFEDATSEPDDRDPCSPGNGV
ncbi:hypothetical protein T484DRAFT_1860635 [Baffinella frigidus]|nr:hypothetical protein T484DRAFT_1860635 [Cryptophyta sp. CCMP2293]